MNKLKGKKLLILAGADVHVKLVKAAKALGVYTIVTDYLDPSDSPAKQIADESWMLNIYDVDEIVKKCKQENIDGVLQYCIDPAQIPYQQICERLNLPCYGTKEQFDILTNKVHFKKFCKQFNVGIVPEYTIEDIENGDVRYPVLVKPTDSRGSRGQTECNSKVEVLKAITIAKEESKDNGYLIERLMRGCQDMGIAYMVVNGEPYLLKIGDRYLGKVEDNLDRQHIATVMPSRLLDIYETNVDPRVRRMIKALGLKFGAVFLQGFYEDGDVLMYDPGLRFPGSDFDIVIKQATGFDAMTSFVEFALTGDVSCCEGDIRDAYKIGGGHCFIFSVATRAGKITTFEGFDDVAKYPYMCSAYKRSDVGEEIHDKGDISQRVAEFCVYIPKEESVQKFADYAYSKLRILDEKGEDMIVSKVHIKE